MDVLVFSLVICGYGLLVEWLFYGQPEGSDSHE